MLTLIADRHNFSLGQLDLNPAAICRDCVVALGRGRAKFEPIAVCGNRLADAAQEVAVEREPPRWENLSCLPMLISRFS